MKMVVGATVAGIMVVGTTVAGMAVAGMAVAGMVVGMEAAVAAGTAAAVIVAATTVADGDGISPEKINTIFSKTREKVGGTTEGHTTHLFAYFERCRKNAKERF